MADISTSLSEVLKGLNLKNPELSTLAKKGDDDLVQRFLTENVQLSNEEKEVNPQSQLYVASFWGFFDVVKALVENGADVNAKNPQTLWTPLHAASFQEHGKIVMFILQHSGDPWAEDFEGRTPVDFGSASDKIWPLFAACGCSRTNKKELTEKGVLRKTNITNVNRQNNAGGNRDLGSIRKINNQINYDSRPSTFDGKNERSAYAASVDGDVLAGENITENKSQSDKPNFKAWRT